jgi:hypothetical protein
VGKLTAFWMVLCAPVWAQYFPPSGGGGAGSVTISGTTNQITATGTACTAGNTGTCVLSLPNPIVLNVTGNVSGSAGTVTSIASHASTDLSDTAGITRGASSLTTPGAIPKVSAAAGTLAESVLTVDALGTVSNIPGIVCNGTADDTAAIQAAITAVAGTSRTVRFPRGKCKATANITVPGDVILEGGGDPSPDGSTVGSYVSFTAGGFVSTAVFHVVFRNMGIETGASAGPAYSVTGGGGWLFERAVILHGNPAQEAIKVTGGSIGNHIDGLYISIPNGYAKPAISLLDSAGGSLNNNTIENVVILGGQTGGPSAPMILLEGTAGETNNTLRHIIFEGPIAGAISLKSLTLSSIDDVWTGDIGGSGVATAPLISITKSAQAGAVSSAAITISNSMIGGADATHPGLYCECNIAGQGGITVQNSFLGFYDDNAGTAFLFLGAVSGTAVNGAALSINASGTALAITAGTEQLTFNSTGLGIGVAPTVGLDVSSPVPVLGGTYVSIRSRFSILIDHGAALYGTNTAGTSPITAFYIDSSDNLAFNTAAPGGIRFGGGGASEWMRLSIGGNLLIGTTVDNGVDKLQVSGSASAAAGGTVPVTATTTTLTGSGCLVKDIAAGTVGCAGDNDWKHFTFSYTNAAFIVASTTASITIQALPANSVVEGIEMDTTTAFAGVGTVAITAATNAAAAELTAAAHGLQTGRTVCISGATGNWAPINACLPVTVTGVNTFTVAVNSTTFGALAGSPVMFSATCAIGDGTTTDIYAPAYGILGAVADTNLWTDGGAFAPRKAAHNMILTCTANSVWGSGAATALTAGVLSIDLKYATRH